MRVLARKGAVVGAVGFALVLSACGGGDEEGAGEDGSPGAEGPTGAVVIEGCQPQNLLIPANTNEVCGGNPLDWVFSKLVKYDPDTAEPTNEIAESIESEDNTTWTITLKDGWTFHDGTPVTAESFVNAWNNAAYGPNAYLNSYFFEPIEGYTEVQGEDANGDEAVTEDEAPVTEMSGLEVVDDKTFTVTLTSPQSSFPQRLGYTAFAPLPEVFYDDPEAFGRQPVGSGPFTVTEYTENASIELTAYEDYQGETKPKVKDVTYKIYADEAAAYNDLLADNIDVMDSLPPDVLAGEQYKADLGDRWQQKEVGVIQTLTFAPESVDPDMSDIELRRAIGQAIDRDLITQNIFAGTRVPATAWVNPVVDGYQPDVCGEWCTYDPESAKQHMEASGYDGTLTITYNADGPHKEWTEAACNSIRNATGVECVATPVPDLATLRDGITNRETKGLLRTGWQMDYPHIENFLVPLYATGASANDGDYSNPEFDAKLDEAAQASDRDEAIGLYQEAEAMLVEDLPAIPLWNYAVIAGYSNNVANVKITPFSTIDILSLELAS